MATVLQIVQILTGLFLIMLIIIQQPKTGGMGVIGGMSQIFSSQSTATTWIFKVTAWTAGIFMGVSFLIGVGLIK